MTNSRNEIVQTNRVKLRNTSKHFDPLNFILMVFGQTWGCLHVSVTQIYIRDRFGFILT